jgi:hypothetical protein
MASECESLPLAFAHRSIRSERSGGIRTVFTGSPHVAGRPVFLRIADFDFAMIAYRFFACMGFSHVHRLRGAGAAFLPSKGGRPTAFLAGARSRPSSSRRRMASDREISLAAAHASIALITSCGTRAVRNGSWPVAGRPRFLRVTLIDLRIVYV